MFTEKELEFSIFIIHSLAENWETSPAEVYKILNSTGILDKYIIACYDVLHTLGKEYLVDDITEYVKEKGVCLSDMIKYSLLQLADLLHMENMS